MGDLGTLGTQCILFNNTIHKIYNITSNSLYFQLLQMIQSKEHVNAYMISISHNHCNHINIRM